MNGHVFQAVLEPDGRRGHRLKVGTKLRQALAVSEGDPAEVTVEPAKGWPEPGLPGDLPAALAGAPGIAGVGESITPMAHWEWVRWINASGNPHTRERRAEVGISELRSGQRRPCCSDLAACTDPDLSAHGKLADKM